MKSLHHSFDIDIATVYGIEEAILIHHFQHWIRINKKRNANFIDGRTWTYQTIDEIADHFPYLTQEEVRGAIERLCTGKGRRSKKINTDFEPVLIKGNYNKTAFDKTVWYAFADEPKFLISNNVYERETSQIEKGDLPHLYQILKQILNLKIRKKIYIYPQPLKGRNIYPILQS